MSFDTTARFATEEQEKPACLPLVSSMGDERAAMTFQFKNGATAEIRFDANMRPLLALRDVPGLPGVIEFTAAQWLDASLRRSAFKVSGGYADDPLVKFSKSEVAGVAKWLLKQIKPPAGRFETVFVAADPSVPF